MATSRAIAILTHEHQIILRVVTAAGHMAVALRDDGKIKVAALRETVGFMRNFADKCHHAKEEDLLFPALVKAGLPEATGPISVLKSEHAQARACMSRLEAAIDAYEKDDPSGRDQIIADIACMGGSTRSTSTRKITFCFRWLSRFYRLRRLLIWASNLMPSNIGSENKAIMNGRWSLTG